LAWHDTSNLETDYCIERSPDGINNWGQIVSVGANVVTYANVGLNPNTPYYYRVRSHNSHGYSSYSNVAGATTPAGSGIINCN